MGSLHNQGAGQITNTNDYTLDANVVNFKLSGTYLVTVWSNGNQASAKIHVPGGLDLSPNVDVSATPVTFAVAYPGVNGVGANAEVVSIAIKRIAQ